MMRQAICYDDDESPTIPTWVLLGSSGWCFIRLGPARSDHVLQRNKYCLGGLHPSTVKFLSGA